MGQYNKAHAYTHNDVHKYKYIYKYMKMYNTHTYICVYIKEKINHAFCG